MQAPNIKNPPLRASTTLDMAPESSTMAMFQLPPSSDPESTLRPPPRVTIREAPAC